MAAHGTPRFSMKDFYYTKIYCSTSKPKVRYKLGLMDPPCTNRIEEYNIFMGDYRRIFTSSPTSPH